MYNDLDNKAKNILINNDKGGYTVPTDGLYPYQWNWDSLFVALGFATFDEARACQEIETLFEAQWDDGFIPHIVFRQDDPDYFPGPNVWQAGAATPTSGISHPPVAASIINKLWRTTDDAAIKARLAALYPKVLAWHRWFHQYRVSEEIPAVVVTHPWESGRDNSPEWDAPAARVDTSAVQPYQRRDLQHADAEMRPTRDDYDRYVALVDYGRNAGWNHAAIADSGPFRVADVGITMILLRAHRDLIEFANNVGAHDAIAELQGYVRLLERGADYLWDAAARTYCSRDVISGAPSGVVTSASFLYCYAGVGSEAQHQAMAQHWRRISSQARFMLPSYDPGDSMFDEKRYWRGPIWLVVNYMLAQGFVEKGMHDWATRVTQDSAELIKRNGFFEAYAPISGEGTGGKAFSWTAAMWLAWCGAHLGA